MVSPVTKLDETRANVAMVHFSNSGQIGKYSYHYKKVLKRRILNKRKDLTDDLHLITKAEDKLQTL